MTLEQKKKMSAHIFRLLKVTEISFPIGRTNKGNLEIKFNSNTDDFEITLDSVPLATKDMLTDDNNIELKKLLTYYLFEQQQYSAMTFIPTLTTANTNILTETIPAPEKKKRGRPKKVV